MSNLDDHGHKVAMAVEEIRVSYGVASAPSYETRRVYGRRTNIGTTVFEHIMNMNQNETFVAYNQNLIATLSSSNASDTTQTIEVDGIYYDATTGRLVRSRQFKTLNGQSQVTLTQPLVRVNRITTDYNLNGDVYLYETGVAATAGVPNDLTKLHDKISIDDNQSEKAYICTPHDKFFVITRVYGAVNRKQAVAANLRFRWRSLVPRFTQLGQKIEEGWKTELVHGISTTGAGLTLEVEPYTVVPPGYEILIEGVAGTADSDISAGFFGFYMSILGDE